MTLTSARLLPAALFQACFLGAVALYKSAANAVVIARYGAQALPWLYIGAALIAAFIAAGSAASPRRRAHPGGYALFGTITCLLAAVALDTDAPFVALAAYVFAEVFTTATVLSLWRSLADAFDARESRRAFTLLNGIGMLGSVLGGLLAQVLAPRVGAPPLFIAAAALLSGASVAWRFQPRLEAAHGHAARKARSAWGYVAATPYTRALGAMVLGFSVLSVLADFLFRQRAGSLLGEAEMASTFGSLQLWNGVFSAGFQLVVAEILLKRFGITRYLAAIPITLGVLALVAAFVPNIWAAWALKLAESGATLSLLPVGFQLLYAPLPDDVRDGSRSALDGFLRKGGLALGGVLLLVAAPFAKGPWLAGAVAALCVVLAVLLVGMRPRYLDMLHTKVGGASSVDLAGLDDLLLVQALRTPDGQRALRAIDLLEASGTSLLPHLRAMMTHVDERVRERGVMAALELHATGLDRELEALVQGPSRRPRDAAVWAMPILAPQRAKALLPPLLSSADVGLKTAAVGAVLLLDKRDVEGRRVLADLLARGPGAPAPERREVARLLGRLHDEDWAQSLARMLDDGEPSVRRIAIEGVGAGMYHSLAPKLLRFLTWRDERRAARQALEELGEAVVPLVAQALDDRSRSSSLRYQLPRVLRHIGTQSALEALLFSNAQDDAFLHYKVGVALSRLKGEREKLIIDAEQLHRALSRRLVTYQTLKGPWRDLVAALGPASLVTRAVGDRLDQAFELSFLLLGLKYGERTMRRAHAQLRGSDAKGRAWARELLDNLLTEDERAALHEPIDAHHRLLPPGDGAAAKGRLLVLAKSDDFVVRTTARAAARKRGEWPNVYKEDDMAEVSVKKLLALEGVEIFAECDVDDLAAIATVAREQSFKAGERVYAEGDPGDAVYIVIEGEAEARRDGELVLMTKVRESFGEVSLFDGAPRLTEVVARADMRTLVIDRRDFLDLLADRPELLTGVFRVLSRQLKSVVMELAARKNTGELRSVPND